MRLLITALLFLFTTRATAQDASASDQALDLTMTKYLIGQVNKKNKAEPPADFDAAGEAGPSKSCVDAYRGLYKKETVNISVTLGYWENLDSPKDKIRRDEWASRLLKPCAPGAEGTCGFTHSDEDNLDLFEKKTWRPDRNPAKDPPHVIRLTLMNSSASTNDKLNRSEFDHDPACSSPNSDAAPKTSQCRQTKRAEANFFGGLKNADVVIYAGHARKGGGPSFGPPDLSADGITPNYSKYVREHLNETKMVSALKEAGDHAPSFLGLFACESGPHFGKDVREAAPRAGLATTETLTESEVGFTQAYAAVDSLLAMRCKDEFNESMNTFKYFGEDCADPRNSEARKSTGPLAPGVTKCVKASQARVENFFKDSSASPSQIEPDAKFRAQGSILDQPLIHPAGAASDRVRIKGPPQGTSGVN